MNGVDICNIHVDRTKPTFNTGWQLTGLNYDRRITDLHLDVNALRTELETLNLDCAKYFTEKLRELDRAVEIRANRARP